MNKLNSSTSMAHKMEDAPPTQMFALPEHVDLSYETTLSEPNYYSNGVCGRAMQPVSRCLETTSDSVQVVIYYVLSVTFGAVLSVIWGIVFGVLNFITIWVAHPFIKVFLVWFRCFYVCTRAATRMLFDPCFESASIVFSRMRGRLNMAVEKEDVEGKSLLEEVNIM